MKIIHLSDLHIGNEGCTENFGAIVEHLNTASEFADDQHYIVITGDLIEDANKDELFSKVKGFLIDLGDRFSGRIFLCPGNHDYGNYWGGNTDLIVKFRGQFCDYMKGCGTIADEAYKVKSDGQHFPLFPLVNIVEDVALIGLDSTAEELEENNDLWAEGLIGAAQRAALEKLLKNDVVKSRIVIVYLHHHPFKNNFILNRLRDADKFCSVIENGVDVLLFGHNHHYANCSSDSQQLGVPLALEGGKSPKCMTFRVIDTADSFRYREVKLESIYVAPAQGIDIDSP